MSFTSRSKSWVGNIYHKFESMCQEVDGLISKDSVNHVGNQVQTAGKNMKRFYSGVVQDLLSPEDNLEGLDELARIMKQNNAIAETGSSCIGDDAVICKSSHLNLEEYVTMGAFGSQYSDNTSSESRESLLHNEGDDVNCYNSHLSFKESVTTGAQRSDSSDYTSSESLESSLHDVGPTTTEKDELLSESFSDKLNLVLSSQVILDGDITKEGKVVTEELGSADYRYSSKSQLLYSALLVESEPLALQKDQMVSTKDATESDSEGSSMLVEQFVTSKSISFDDNDKSLPEEILISTDEDYEDLTFTESSPSIKHHDIDKGRKFTDGGTACSSFSNASYHVSAASYDHRQLNEKTMRAEQLPNVGSTSSEDISLRSHVLSIDQEHESTRDDTDSEGKSSSFEDKTLPKEPLISTDEDYEDLIFTESSPSIQHHDIDKGRKFTDGGTACSSFSSASYLVSDVSYDRRQLHEKNMSVEQSPNMGSSFSEDISLRSHALSIDQEHESKVTSVTSVDDQRSRKLHCHADSAECGSRVSSASSSNFSGASEDDLKHYCQPNQSISLLSPMEIDPCLETIDLSDKEKPDINSIPMDNIEPLCTISFRPRRFKSYKKIIQDALASRKGLVKEYKQLAVYHADFNTENSEHPRDITAIVPDTCLHSKSQSCMSCESGWELL